MQTKRYHNSKRRENNSGDHDILGIVFIIISAFILLCIIIKPILGIISKGIAAVTLGVFGLFAYPLFLSTLILGIALIQHRQVSLARRFVIGIAIMVASLMFILQLATTHGLISGNFSAYISGTYYGVTAGGLLFGMIAYGIAKAVTLPVAYVIFSLAFLCALGFCVILPLYRNKRERSENDFPAPSPFVKGNGATMPTRPISDTSLYVDTIIRHTSDPYIDRGESAEPILPKPSPTHEISDDSDKTKREKAYKELFGNAGTLYLPPLTGEGSTSGTGSISGKTGSLEGNSALGGYVPPYVPPVAPVVPTTHIDEKPAKRVHAPTAPVVPQVPDKDISSAIIGGEIINGSDYSRQLEEANAQIQREAERVAPQAGVFTTKKLEVTPARPKEQLTERPAIVNGDYFGGPPKKQTQSVLPPTYTATPTASSSVVPTSEKPRIEEPGGHVYEQTDLDDFIQESVAKEQATQPPIIAASEYERELTAEERFQKLINETKEQHAEQRDTLQTQVEEDDDSLDYDVPDPIADEDMGLLDEPVQPRPPVESSLRIEEEPIDLSEHSHFEGVDSTGYYETTAMPSKPATQPQPQIRANEQLKIDDIISPIPAAKAKKRKRLKYDCPDTEMLVSADTVSPEAFNIACEEKARLLEETLQGLKLPVKVGAITRGPAVTRYELEMPPGIPIKRIEQYSTDIEYYLESNGKIRIEAPIPGKRAVGIEVPNESIDIVRLRDIIESKEFKNSSSPLTLAIGKDIAGTNIICNLEKMPHLLIAGATNSGKSACLNSIIMSIIYKSSPDDVRIILIDPKRVEFNMYQGIPHLLSEDIINDAQQAINALTWAKEEMDSRYILMSKYKVRNLAEFNKCEAVKSGEEAKLPYIVLIVDELAELMLDSSNKKELENKIVSMSQKARAAGIHLILATQRPSVDVITGIIKANLPSRIAFSVKSIVDSRTILDGSGAETLLGRGDMLYAPMGMDEPRRVQGAFVTEQEISAVTEFIRENNDTDFDEEFTAAISKREEEPESTAEEDDNKEFDDLMPEILKCVIESGSVSISMIQRRFSVGYARAARIVDQMEAKKFVGPNDGSNKPRAVYITREQYREIFGTDV